MIRYVEKPSSHPMSKDNPLSLRARLAGLGKYRFLTCLDLGCGRNESPISKQVLAIPWRVLTSVDAWQPNIEKLIAKRANGEIAAALWNVFCEPMEELVPRLRGRHDVILLLDALEHLEKPIALELLGLLEGLQPKRILIWLPLGNCPQGALEGNPYEVHKSTWSAMELESLGFDVYVFSGFHRHIVPWVDAAWAVRSF